MTLGYVIALHEQQGNLAVAWASSWVRRQLAALLLPLFVKQIWLAGSSLWPLHAGTRRCLGLLVPLVLARSTGGWSRWSIASSGLICRRGSLASGLCGATGQWPDADRYQRPVDRRLSGDCGPCSGQAAGPSSMSSWLMQCAFFLFLIVPVCVGVAAFRRPVVRLLFEHGRFTSGDTAAVALLVGSMSA